MATGQRHVGFESWAERDFLIAADFDHEVVAVSSQPFTLNCVDDDRNSFSHTPDFFLRLSDGSACVVDVRPDGLVKAPDEVKFRATRLMCDELGWSYRRIGDQLEIYGSNLRWLAGYRFPRAKNSRLAEVILERMCNGKAKELGRLSQEIGHPVTTLPTIFHLLWTHRLRADLHSRLLTTGTEVTAGMFE